MGGFVCYVSRDAAAESLKFSLASFLKKNESQIWKFQSRVDSLKDGE